MARELFVELQTPVVELVVEASDAAGTNSSIVVGFKRYIAPDANSTLPDEGKEILLKFEALNESYLTELKKEERSIPRETEIQDEIKQLVKDHILFIKGCKLPVYDSETRKLIETLKVSDTRTAKPDKDFWETPEECLTLLAGYYLKATPWESPLFLAFQKSLLNQEIDLEALLKN